MLEPIMANLISHVFKVHLSGIPCSQSHEFLINIFIPVMFCIHLVFVYCVCWPKLVVNICINWLPLLIPAIGNSIIFHQHHKSLSEYSSFYSHDISFLSLFFFFIFKCHIFIYVALNFYFQLNFSFPLSLCMLMYGNNVHKNKGKLKINWKEN